MSHPENKPVQRDPRNGQVLKGSGSPNPGGRKKAHRAYLRQLLGERGERAYDAILDIAEGRTSFEVLAREPGPNEDLGSAAQIPIVRRVPSIRERLDAWEFLAEQLNGKAPQSIEVEGEITHTHAVVDVTKLAARKLDELERLLDEAAIEGDGEIVDSNAVAVLPSNTRAESAAPDSNAGSSLLALMKG